MRVAIVSDAWHPQVNGVVRTFEMVTAELEARGHQVEVHGPDQFRTWPCPGYPEIRLALQPKRALTAALEAFDPEAIHVATEGPLGFAARRYCRSRNLVFTTSFHTRFPEYLHARTRVPLGWSYAWLRNFHADAARVMVATPSIEAELSARRFDRLVRWTRGVDTQSFHPGLRADPPPELAGLKRPLWLYVGRIAVEKNIEAFLALDLDGTKLVVGDGPLLPELRRQFPQACFVGARRGSELARFYAASDVFVFPSRTDTFGLVLLEALASGLPVAAYPVPGPRDVITDEVGALDADLARAARRALTRDRATCRGFAEAHSWSNSMQQFLTNLVPVR